MLGFLLGAALGAGVSASAILVRRKQGQKDRSTTSSAGGGASAYETRKAVDEYLQFHFGAAEDILPYACGPKDALGFPARCAALAEKHCTALQDFNGEGCAATALDIGCAVGGSTFELARGFAHVLGIDFSEKFVEAAQELQKAGEMTYTASVEAEITERCVARVPKDIELSRVRFMQGDACALPADLAAVDALLAANLLCRLPEPRAFLARLPSLIKPGGIALLVSPYSWLSAWTSRDKWLGGYVKDNKPVRTAAAVAEAMEAQGFELIHQCDMPFLIREHVRKYQWGCSHATVWRRV